MSDLAFTAAIGLVVFVFGGIGLTLQRILPERFTTGAPKDLIGAMAGLLTLLTALVLGLLIWTAYGVYSSQNVAIQTLAAKLLQLDLALADYGPEAGAGRAQLRQDLAHTLRQVWDEERGDEEFVAENFAAAIDSLRHKEGYLNALTPETDGQKRALASATQTIDAIAQSRLQIAFGLSSPFSTMLIYVVTAWVAGLFCAYGLMSRASVMAFIVFAFGAVAIASAMYVILDLSAPYSGAFRASPAPLERVLSLMSRDQGRAGGQR
jgi:hypothetical protein